MLNTQSLRDDDPNLAILLDRVVEGLRPEAVYLSGSRASGHADAGSDYDLLVVVPDTMPTDRIRLTSTQALIDGTGIPADIIACRRRLFDRDRRQIGSLSYKVVREGILIYGA